MNGVDNFGFESTVQGKDNETRTEEPAEKPEGDEDQDADFNDAKRATWGSSVQFLMSCIALSIGFGNVWRFPSTAFANGGGAFLIPYIIVLILVGKPFYYLEMILGQFSSSSHIKVWTLSPGFRGVGWAQMCSLIILASYYCALMALNLFYLIASFSSELPWAYCRDEWNVECIDSGRRGDESAEQLTTRVENNSSETNVTRSSAELYFRIEVLKEYDHIDYGIGLPEWRLTLCLLGCWLTIGLVLSRGVKSSGKASYFLAIFPYVIMITLLIKALTLDGAMDGILFFISPQWDKLLDPTVWMAAITQCFFSLSVCFGSIIMYSSHNEFRHNIYRDALIVTTLDTFTSLMAGCTIFGILGNLAYELGTDDISTVVRGGTGLAFISYPDAIAKFTWVPQLFSVLFFTMMFVLGVGSGVGIASGIIMGICDQCPTLKRWHVMVCVVAGGFALGTIYVTPGGQFILNLVDHYGASFIVYVLATFELTGVMWVYGLENILDDIEFMSKNEASAYWRVCWTIVTPFILIAVFIYSLVVMDPLTYLDVEYPTSAHAAGWSLMAFGILQIPIWMLIALLKHRGLRTKEMVRSSFKPSSSWGPLLSRNRKEWIAFKEERSKLRKARTGSWLAVKLRVLLNLKSGRSKFCRRPNFWPFK